MIKQVVRETDHFEEPVIEGSTFGKNVRFLYGQKPNFPDASDSILPLHQRLKTNQNKFFGQNCGWQTECNVLNFFLPTKAQAGCGQNNHRKAKATESGFGRLLFLYLLCRCCQISVFADFLRHVFVQS